tara:strand:- start:6003 stop:6131 length:129 start_codon:yes stop_codon:yes gene_type:complete
MDNDAKFRSQFVIVVYEGVETNSRAGRNWTIFSHGVLHSFVL